MHFGVFIEELRSGVGEADAFRESFETVDAAEALGFDCIWLGEIHFNPARSVLSSPIADRKSTRLNSSHLKLSRMPSSA